jgi:hypothetical protein
MMAKTLSTEKHGDMPKDANTEALEKEIESFFGSKVSIKSGKIEIKYSSADELDKIVNKLRGEV